VNLAKARWVQMMHRRLENIPEHRRAIAEERLNKLISRSYQEAETLTRWNAERGPRERSRERTSNVQR
jgi:hypothetical protein